MALMIALPELVARRTWPSTSTPTGCTGRITQVAALGWENSIVQQVWHKGLGEITEAVFNKLKNTEHESLVDQMYTTNQPDARQAGGNST